MENVAAVRGQWSEHMVRDANTLAPGFDERVELRLSGLLGNTVFQTPDEKQPVAAAGLSIGGVQPKGQPNLGSLIFEGGAGRHDADDIAPSAVDFHSLSDHRTCTKRALPQLVRKNSGSENLIAGYFRFFRRKQSALSCLDTQSIQQTAVDGGHAHPPRPIPAVHIRLTFDIGSNGGKRPVHLAELHVLGCRYTEF